MFSKYHTDNRNQAFLIYLKDTHHEKFDSLTYKIIKCHTISIFIFLYISFAMSALSGKSIHWNTIYY